MAETTEEQAPKGWNSDIFGCFDDCRLCIFTFLVPGYTLGRNAEHFGEDCLLNGALYCIGMVALGPVLRWRLREQKNLKGSMLSDVVVHMFCPCCAIMQESKEIYGIDGCHIGEKIPIIDRK